MPPEKTDYATADESAFAGSLAAILDERPAHCSFTMEEMDYLARLVAVDQQRMVQDYDHAIAYGARNYPRPKEHDYSLRLIHSFNMARTAAALAAIDEMEGERADR